MDKEFIRRLFIDFYFDGDESQFRKAEPVVLGDWDDVNFELDECLKWDSVRQSLKSPIPFAEAGLQFLRYHLGYLPKPSAYMPQDRFLTGLVASYGNGNIPVEQFFKEFEYHSAIIRRKDLDKHGCRETGPITDRDLALYQSHLPQFKEAAKERLAFAATNVIEPEHSLYAEIFLRQLFKKGGYYLNMPMTEIDYRAAAIYYHRKFMQQDVKIAANLPLLPLVNAPNKDKVITKFH